MLEFLMAIADLASGHYELLTDGTIKANDLMGMISGCAEVSDTARCVNAAIDFEGGK